MPNLYPLLLRPEFHERVWGSRNLAPIYSGKIGDNPIGEAWLIGDACVAANGPLAGRPLASLSLEYGRRLLGEITSDALRFPLLIKYLFPQGRLSVQVHPDDKAAARVGQPCGKTECWYVLEAGPGAQIGLGLKPGTTKVEVERAIRETTMEHLLNWIEICPGDMFYVDGGTVHTIGGGSVILETQQNSDTTYRLYDYGRARALHVSEGLRAAKERTHAGKVAPSRERNENGKEEVNLITSPSFVIDKFKVTQPWQFQRPLQGKRSVWCLVATRGYGVIEGEGAPPVTVGPGEAVVVPAEVDWFILKPQWELEFLCSSLPVEPVGHPVTIPAENAAAKAT